MDKNLSRAIAQRFCALRRVRGDDYSLVSVYESELKGALSILVDLRLISVGEWDRLNTLASKLALIASGCGWHSVRKYNAARAALANRSSATSSEKVIQDESEQVPAPAAPGQLRLLGVLGAQVLRPATGQPLKSSAYVNIESFDGLRPDRIEFPRLGKHWSPASVLVGYQEPKGHAFLRA